MNWGSSAYLEHKRAISGNYSSLFAFCIIVIVLGLWSYRYIIRPYLEKRKLRDWLALQNEGKKFQVNEQIFNALFQGFDAASVSKAERKRLRIDSDEFVYGEIEFPSFIAILESVEPKEYENFYDLGCGTGKAVFAASLCYDFDKTVGIELLPGLYNIANRQVENLQRIIAVHGPKFAASYQNKINNISFINDDILNCDISDADIVFINATCFNPTTWVAIVQKLLELKVGTRVIMTTKRLDNEAFRTIYNSQYLMSWGMNSVNAYEKII
jgi:SAM-dependent methyltransferase